MPSRVRRGLATAVLLLAAPFAPPGQTATAAPVEACNPAPRTDTSLCASYDVTVTAHGTATPTTQSQATPDLRFSFANTSTNYVVDPARTRWFDEVTATLLTSGAVRPTITGSAGLPDKLLLAGSAAGCGPGADFSFSSCDAGYGVAWVQVNTLVPPVKYYKVTYGIDRIYNNRALLANHFGAFTTDMSYCIDVNGATMSCNRAEDHTLTLIMDRPAGDDPWTLDFVLPLPNSALNFEPQGIGIDTLNLHLLGRSDQLLTGPATPPATFFKLPVRCGAASANGTATAHGGSTVTVARTVTITGCSQIDITSAPAKLRYGKTGTLVGRVTDFDTGQPIKNLEVQLRTCTVLATEPCGVTTGAVLTTSTGGFSFDIKPAYNTHYFVKVPPVNGHPSQWAMRLVSSAPKVTLSPKAATMPTGGNLAVSGEVTPHHPGLTVNLQRRLNGAWATIADTTLASDSTYSMTIQLNGPVGSTTKLRVVTPEHTDHAQGVSNAAIVTFS